MTEHTPTPLRLVTEQGLHKIIGPHHPAIGDPTVAFHAVYGRGVGHQDLIDECQATAERLVAAYNAFHSEDGREIATEKIEPGLVWQLIDTLEDLMVGDNDMEAAEALLAKLEDTGQ